MSFLRPASERAGEARRLEGSSGTLATESLRRTLREAGLAFLPMSEDAALLAARAWVSHRRVGVGRVRIAADCLIGAHALLQADRLLSRDAGLHRDCFPQIVVAVPAP